MDLDWQPPSTNTFVNISDWVEEHRARIELPALAVAVTSSSNVIAAGASGLRKLDDDTQVTLQDKFHIGSVTKSMTSLLAVMLAEEGHLALTNRIPDLLPDWEMRPEFRDLTLKLLLQHRSGLQKQAPRPLWRKAWNFSGSGAEQRAQFVPEVLMTQPEVEPNTQYLYSNLGYSIAGTMIERTMGKDWEDLIHQYIFHPLGMTSAGFGPPSSDDEVDQPWGHTLQDGEIESVPPLDNPASIGPGGIVHANVLDMARYAAFHLALANDRVAALKGTRELLYLPPEGQDYALGWRVLERSWAGRGPALTHNGTNNMFFCVVWLAPARDIAFIIMTNAGQRGEENKIHEGCDSVAAALIKRFLPR